jgi:hypothetical protein
MVNLAVTGSRGNSIEIMDLGFSCKRSVLSAWRSTRRAVQQAISRCRPTLTTGLPGPWSLNSADRFRDASSQDTGWH